MLGAFWFFSIPSVLQDASLVLHGRVIFDPYTLFSGQKYAALDSLSSCAGSVAAAISNRYR